MTHQEQGGNRLPYQRASLMVFGQLTDLTAGGTGSVQENTGKDTQPDKRP